MSYVPPHLRNRQGASASASSAPPPSASPRQPTANGAGSGPAGGAYSSPSRSTPHARSPWSSGPSDRRQDNNSRPRTAGPSLHVFGDSFAGPFKLLSDTSVRTRSFKGASAKGLNNPKSIKQVSNELLPLLNSLLAPPPYAYLPPTGRYAILVFGNVDLQINYLWQLMNKPMGPGTFNEVEEVAEVEKSGEAMGERDVLANATESTGKIALGPERFVDSVAKAYCTWLEREVVNGPIGRRAAEVAKADSATPLPPTKVLVAGALPPLVEDDTLPRIPMKYVERLVEDHTKAARAIEGRQERGSRTPWAKKTEPNGTGASPNGSLAQIESGMAAMNTFDKPIPSPTQEQAADMTALFAHNPPLVTKPVRIAMTERFNAKMKAFCAQHPQVLGFVDIGDVMLSMDKADGVKPAFLGEVSRATWACPVDPSNIHPLWEPTIPLWLDKLKKFGLQTDKFEFSTDAEETFRAYEEDKKMRTARRDKDWEQQDEQKTRIKLREE